MPHFMSLTPESDSTPPPKSNPSHIHGLPWAPCSPRCSHGAPPLRGNIQCLPTAPKSASCPFHPGYTCPGNRPLLGPPRDRNCSTPCLGPWPAAGSRAKVQPGRPGVQQQVRLGLPTTQIRPRSQPRSHPKAPPHFSPAESSLLPTPLT